MKENYLGLDVLRGIGIFSVIFLHTAFYYFSGLYDVDFSNPPTIVTLIGLLLMFAGLFAVISGFVHTWQRNQKKNTNKQLLKYGILSGFLMLLIAYIYFIFTGPGIVNLNQRSMNNSILVELIRNGRLIFTNVERVFYVDSLVMIGLNIILLTFFSYGIRNVKNEKKSRVYLLAAIIFMVFSIIRIPLYKTWSVAMNNDDYFVVFLLNALVAKNNPIFPFFSFALFGGWIATLFQYEKLKEVLKRVIPLASFLLILGIGLYANLEETMLERAIDLKWYSIMVAQLGLFMLLIISVIKYYDFRKNSKSSSLTRFFSRFSKGGLTAFFLESVVSAIIFRILRLFQPDISFDMGMALLYGLVLSLFWGFLLKLWSNYNYKYSIEYFISKILNKHGESSKLKKLYGEHNETC